jgi:hypothetical protein
MASANLGTAYDPNGLVVKSDKLFGETITLVPGTYAAGAALGQITTGGKYALSASAAADGSQAVRAILPQAITNAADASVYVYYTGDFDATKVVLGAGHTIAALRPVLARQGIFLHDVVPGA